MDASEMASMMSGMSGMGGIGMDSSSSGTFVTVNQSFARIYWYIIAAIVGLACLVKGLTALDTSYRKRTVRTLSISYPTRPRNFLTQLHATTTAIFREIAYPQALYFSRPFWQWATPPPLGQSLIVVAYMAVITLFLTLGSIVDDAYYWERIGFRAAWISVTQVPFVFLLGGKVNILSLFLGSSYVDLNWLHRWVSRTLFVTVTIHGTFFLREWIRADFLETELAMMPMVKYGLGLWGVLAWINVTSFLPLRRLCYEFFVLQHLVSGVVFLWLLSRHLPAYAMYNLWMAIAFLLVGRSIRGLILLYRNLMIKKNSSGSHTRKLAVGYPAELNAMPGDFTVLTIHDAKFSWKAGQHVFICCPSMGPLEDHPFTISNVSHIDHKSGTYKMELIIRARSGFTRRLNRRAVSSGATIRTFVTGPFGNLPTWNSFETVVLISACTGASFTLPILQSILDEPCCVSRVDCFLILRHKSHLSAYLPRLQEILLHPRCAQVGLNITIAITGKENEFDEESTALKKLEHLSPSLQSFFEAISDQSKMTTTVHVAPSSEKSDVESTGMQDEDTQEHMGSLHFSSGRPNIRQIIKEPVEASGGETSVVVCGGRSLTSEVRNRVAILSDDRAVHKGSGAQGIHLHVESFGS